MEVDRPTLLIRADASVAIGTGHVMRCLALAQGWQDAGGRAVFAMAECTPALAERLKSEGMQIVAVQSTPGSESDAGRVAELANREQAAALVVDGYGFGAEYQRAVKQIGRCLLFIDDYGHGRSYVADFVLNQNAHADESFYVSRSEQTKLLLGPRYAMLRREFWTWRQWQRKIADSGSRLLLTFGGSDPDNVTTQILAQAEQIDLPGLEITVAVGGSNPHLDTLIELQTRSKHSIQIIKDATNMPELMAWADLAISGAGATCWEMCFLGLPALLIDLAPNQTPIARKLNELGVARHIGHAGSLPVTQTARVAEWLLGSADVRRKMSHAGRELVDGRGVMRVFAIMRGIESLESPGLQEKLAGVRAQ